MLILPPPPPQVAAEQKKAEARQEHEASQAAVKAGPLTASTAGIAVDNENRTSGSYNQTAGSAKEALGGLLGNEQLKAAGQRQHREGQQQEAQGQLKDYGHGISDRVQGTVGSALSGLTNDREARERYDQLHDEGKTRQRGVEEDLTKEVEARQRAEQAQDPFN
jgi:uncharacterized protein YjbJ (UPF0337 family)